MSRPVNDTVASADLRSVAVTSASGAPARGGAGTGTTIDVAVLRRRPLPVAPWVAAVSADAAAVALLVAFHERAALVAAAAILHVAVAVTLALPRALERSERALAVSLALALPVFGAGLAALALFTVGRAEVTQQAPGEPPAPRAPDPEEVRRMAEALPCCEALLHGHLDERRAVLSTLTRRADADAVALLRWALGAPDADLAVEAALALEDIGATFEGKLAAARRAVRERPGFETAMEAAEVVSRAVDAGIVDPSLVPSLAHEARGLYEEAARLDPARVAEAALARARLELVVLRPDSALECIDEALPAAVDADQRRELLALREEAVLASHVLPWEGPSALASYRPAAPPPLTSRRRLIRGGTRGTGTGRLVPVTRTDNRTETPTLTSRIRVIDEQQRGLR